MSLYVPIQPAQQPDPSGFLFDLEMQFLRHVRKQPTVTQWHRRFAWEPSGAFAELNVRMPVDLTSFSFQPWPGHFEFQEGTSTYIPLTIDAFSAGTHLDVRKLRNPIANEIIGWNQRAEALMGAWDRFDPPKIAALLAGGETAISGGHMVTGGAAFFAEDHNYNRDHTEYGTFSNLLDDGGALASEPIYFVISGGGFDNLKPWAILKGAGMGDAIKRGGGSTTAPSNGDPWIVKFGIRDDADLAANGMKVKMGVYAEKGYGLLFPHTIFRYEGDFDYAGFKGVVDEVCTMKDLNGYNPASQIKIEAILCAPGQVSTINGILGREVTDTGARQVDLRIDSRLQAAAVIPMDQ